ncbi:hypothetical protein MKW92_022859 [Papaver armeniacum]|nr:hypothetical protein MKW92_022859 [Papaver armeniacum]
MMMLLISGLILSKKKKKKKKKMIVFDHLLFGLCGLGNLSKRILHRTMLLFPTYKAQTRCYVHFLVSFVMDCGFV